MRTVIAMRAGPALRPAPLRLPPRLYAGDCGFVAVGIVEEELGKVHGVLLADSVFGDDGFGEANDIFEGEVCFVAVHELDHARDLINCKHKSKKDLISYDGDLNARRKPRALD